jgi:hypothetical protein
LLAQDRTKYDGSSPSEEDTVETLSPKDRAALQSRSATKVLTHRNTRSALAALAGLALGLLALSPLAARAEVKEGATLGNAEIRDASDKPAQIPELGNKILLIMYTDPDEADQNDAFADAVKAKTIDQNYFKSVGIANMKDAPAKPNWIIRSIVRGKIKKYNVTILTDPDRLLIKAWDLGDCNNKSVVLIIDKNKTLRFFRKGKLSDTDHAAALKLLDDLVADAKAGK